MIYKSLSGINVLDAFSSLKQFIKQNLMNSNAPNTNLTKCRERVIMCEELPIFLPSRLWDGLQCIFKPPRFRPYPRQRLPSNQAEWHRPIHPRVSRVRQVISSQPAMTLRYLYPPESHSISFPRYVIAPPHPPIYPLLPSPPKIGKEKEKNYKKRTLTILPAGISGSGSTHTKSPGIPNILFSTNTFGSSGWTAETKSPTTHPLPRLWSFEWRTQSPTMWIVGSIEGPSTSATA